MARAALQWSLDDLSKCCGISLSTIARFEVGVHTPKKLYLELIRNKLEAAGVRFTKDGGVVPPPGS